MRRKLPIVLASLVLVTVMAEAGQLVREPISCLGPSQLYFVSWFGPWKAGVKWLEYGVNATSWDWYSGFLEDVGCISSPELNRYYRIMGCRGNNCSQQTASIYVPSWAPCEGAIP
ncbi:MAG: hypothetical protein OES99_12800 [Gammaproteobacteria bacterium]|nr:hypothetical protein [Gammaproteobacteria bacterium]